MASSARENICPEKRLLVCCARTQLSSAIAEEIRVLAAGSLDWDYLFAEAGRNSLRPLLARQLSACASEIVPPQHLKRFIDAARANTGRSLILTAELIHVMSRFREAGIVAVPYKGPVIAAQAYGDITLREFEDLDIVLRQRDMLRANDVVTGLGYLPKFPWDLSAGSAFVPGEYQYRDVSRRKVLELHTEGTLRHFPVPPDLEDIARRLAPVLLSGHEILTFTPEDALVMLSIHGSKDFWERISWIADIAELIRANPSLDWDAALRRADSWNARRILNLGLALASGVLEAQLPAEIEARVRGDRVAAQLASEVAGRILSREQPAMGAGARFSYRRRMIDAALGGWRYAIRLAFVPVEDDWQMVRLPAALAPLYVALRPLRLLRKYGVGRGDSHESA
ncbi:MAG TPA: nucleotidyltransferase family protein [Candidatus Baltobacteraceae bacterium]|nr:nucleotidyltransferase family protein [Candidatus Baltobacteraceae bacterium]